MTSVAMSASTLVCAAHKSRHRTARAPDCYLARLSAPSPTDAMPLRRPCRCAVPGGPNRPNKGAIPPVPPGPLHAPNLTPPTIEGLTVREFQQALQTFFQLLPQAEAEQASLQLPPELANLDQLKVLLDALPDYPPEDVQPSYVLAIPCRPILVGLSTVLPGLPFIASINWLCPTCPPPRV